MRSVLLWSTLLCVLGGAGCVGSKTQQCSWGAVCPTDRYCEESLGRCLHPAQAEVCRGVQDESPLVECTFTDAPPGAYACRDGLCLQSFCGDGYWGPGELCDDGNEMDGDGCSANCLSAEQCGNGIVDPAAGEACDDGDLASHDGCSSGCTLEGIYYELLASSLPARFGAAAAYDPTRQQTVVFSGFTSEPMVLNDLWLFDGVAWLETATVNTPEGRIDAAMTYLPSRGRVVMFGGWNGYDALDDLWEFDGTDWSRIYTVSAPPPRNAHAFAYDAGRDRLVIFGGEQADRLPLGDVWEYDSNDWIEVTLDASPVARRYASLAYDERTGRLVLFGGSREQDPTSWVFLDDTWEYDGSTWTEITPPVAPSPRHGQLMGWDPVGERIVLFGGMGDSGALDDTWVYDSGTWSPLFTAASPPPRGQFIMTRDALQDSLVVRTGHAGNYECYQDAWGLVGDDWVQFAAEIPKARVAPGMAFDSVRGVTVMFGGETYSNTGQYFGDTWLFSDHVWRMVTPPGAPPARTYSPLVFDSLRSHMVLFGGCNDECNNLLNDTWVFDGASWSAPTVPVGPTARAQHAMTYDASAAEVVLFGGASNYSYRADTWWFNGDRWRTDNLSPSPPPLARAEMAYDAHRNVTVLFGGWTAAGTYQGDTWELRSDGWRQVFPAVSPPARVGHRMIYHAGRRRILLYGGYADTEWFTEIWEYDGITWTNLALPTGTPWHADFGLVYDSWEREVVLFGGFKYNGTASSEAWAYYYDGNWPDEICNGNIDDDDDGLIDCADPDCYGRPCSPSSVCTAGVCP